MPGNEGVWEDWGPGSHSSWKMRSYLRYGAEFSEIRNQEPGLLVLLKHVSLGRAGTWQPARLVPEEMGRAAVAASRRPGSVASFLSGFLQ